MTSLGGYEAHYVVPRICEGCSSNPDQIGGMIGPMTIIDMGEMPDHDQVSERVRMELAQKLMHLCGRFEMFLDDDPRDLSPGMVANYLTAVRMLGGLYQTFARPVDRSGSISVERVEKMIEAARMQAAEEAREVLRLEQAADRRLALESAGSKVREDLVRERERRERQGL